MNFTLKNINQDRSITVAFDIDGLDQNISGAPLDNIDALNQFLFDYGTAYESGINQTTAPQVAVEVTALVGQSMSLKKGVDNAITSTVSAIPLGKGVVSNG